MRHTHEMTQEQAARWLSEHAPDCYYRVEDWMWRELGLRNSAVKIFAVLWGFASGVVAGAAERGEEWFWRGPKAMSRIVDVPARTCRRVLRALVCEGLVRSASWADDDGVPRSAYAIDLVEVATRRMEARGQDHGLFDTDPGHFDRGCDHFDRGCGHSGQGGMAKMATPIYPEEPIVKEDGVRVRACEGEERSAGKGPEDGGRPSREDFEAFVSARCPALDAPSLWEELEAFDWVDAEGRPIRSWKGYVLACDRRAAKAAEALAASGLGVDVGGGVRMFAPEPSELEEYARLLWDRMKDELVAQGFDWRALDAERPLAASELGVTAPPKGWREMLGAPVPSGARSRAKTPRPRKGQAKRHGRKGGRR